MLQPLFSKRSALAFLLSLTALIALVQAQPTTAPSAVSGEDVLRHLTWMIEWYRGVNTPDAGSDPRDLLYKDSVAADSKLALQQAFAYGRARAAMLSSENAGGGSTLAQSDRAKRVAKATADAIARVAALAADLAAVNKQIEDGAATTRPDLIARRDKIASGLNLATARRDTLQKFSGFIGSAGGAGLLDKIVDLERSVPDAAVGLPAPSPTSPQPAPADGAKAAAAATIVPPFHPESAGIFGLVSQMFTLSGRMRELGELDRQTEHLSGYVDTLRQPIRSELLDAIKRGDTLAATRESDSIAMITADRQQIDALATRFKQLSAVAVPLGAQSIELESARNNLVQWHDSLSRQFNQTLRYLVLRLGAMAMVILIVLGVSSLWRRGTFRYISDVRRRRQFLVVRRFVVGSIIFLVLIIGFVTEFGSLATYAGLLTAGIAVALQTVILSGVAYFFVIGRYGIRVGDRVTVAGVSGDVIDVGLFRLYLMELGGSNLDLHPTGRIVVFANSVLFQSVPFYKQLPGSEYMFHQIALTLSPDSDYHLAETKLMEAVNGVYATYHDEIDREHAAAMSALHVPLSNPKPEGRLRFVDAGLEFIVRYPVPIHRAAEIDDLVTRGLLKTIEAEPNLRLCATGTPKIQSATPR